MEQNKNIIMGNEIFVNRNKVVNGTKIENKVESEKKSNLRY